MKNWSFFKEAVKSFRTTGSITASSPALVKKLVGPLPTDRPLTIVELGPGDGCVTKAILERVHPDSKVIAFEINPAFVEKLGTINDARLRVEATGAENLHQYFSPGSVDYVMSSLPLSMIPKQVKEEILKQSQQVLKPEGNFYQFQYALQDYGLLKDHFQRVSISFTMANLPPAFIYTCSLGMV